MDAQPGGAGHGRQIAGAVIAADDGFRDDRRRRNRHRRKADLLQGRHAARHPLRRPREQLFARVRREIFRRQMRQPSPHIGCIDSIGLAILLDHFIPVKDHLVLVAVERDAVLSEQGSDCTVPFDSVGFIVAVGVDRPDGVVAEQLPPHFQRTAVADEQAAARFRQLRIDLPQGLMDKSDAAVVPVIQIVKDLPVEYKERQHRAAFLESMIESRIVLEAEVAAKPEYSDGLHEGHLLCGREW